MSQVCFAALHEAIGATRPDQLCLVYRERRFTWADITERTRRLANFLIDRGHGCHRERLDLDGHESGQDHLAIYLHNCNEYLESMVGAWKARVAPFNVNFRYVEEELRYLFGDSEATAVVIHSEFAPTLAGLLPELTRLRTIIQVPDESGNGLLPGAVWYDDALAAGSPARPNVVWSADDLYILYTGGTTGMPKGVMWRNGDAIIECFNGSRTANDLAGFLESADTGLRTLPAPPFMHGAAHWVAMRTWIGGGTVFIQSVSHRLDPADVWSVVEREQVTFLLIVGDAFARPLLDELDRGRYDVSGLNILVSGGAALSATLKDEFLEHLPALMIVDGFGSSEAGSQMSHVSTAGTAATGVFNLTAGNHVLSADLTRVLEPGATDIGWLAKTGRLALGYLNDADKTAGTYPVVDGIRYAIPGDRARHLASGQAELHGRDSATINSGGEKIFAEEVEAAIKLHPDVYDCVVAGRPSDRWGSEVVAVVRLREGASADHDALCNEAGRHIARYKLPKATVFVDELVRSPSGKADYRWASSMVTKG